MRTLAAACAACVVSGCALWPGNDSSPATTAVRTRPPNNYRASVADWFDLMTPGPTPQRRLAFGTPEASDCALYGPGGRHQGWMVPVIYDTSVATAGAGGKTSSAGTAAATGKPAPTVMKDGQATATLQDVKISGKGYFFWFSSDTIEAVSRRADICPP